MILSLPVLRFTKLAVACALVAASILPLNANTALAQAVDASYQTVNGQETLSSMTDQLRNAGYGGPWDQASVVAAYASTSGGPVTPVVAAAPQPQPKAAVDCAGSNQVYVYQTWDRTGSSGPCAPWSGYQLIDPNWVASHATFGLGTYAGAGEAVVWACGVVIGAQRAVDAPVGVNIYVRGASGMSSPWNDSLIRRYGPQPCSVLQASFANLGPDVYYRQAW